jgi:probable HAF family extracellular repeat protein
MHVSGWHRALHVACVCFCALGASSPANAEQAIRYRLRILHPPYWRDSDATAISTRGDVVGSCSNGLKEDSSSLAEVRAFRWYAGRFTLFPKANASSFGNGVDELGGWGGAYIPWVPTRTAQRSGNGGPIPGLMRGFYIGPRGKLRVLKPSNAAFISQVKGVGPQGVCVGTSLVGERAVIPTVWRSDVPVRLRTFDGKWNDARAANARGVIVGMASRGGHQRCVVWYRGRIRVLASSGGTDSEGTAINSQGDVVGQSDERDGSRQATLWVGALAMRLGTLGGRDSYATGINDRREVVGYSAIPGKATTHAFVWRRWRLADLNRLCRLPTGLVLTEARAINNRGWIVAKGQIDGATRACLLVPIGGKPVR